MIEAVNSVLSNAASTKAVVEQQSVAQSFAANPDRVQVVPQAPFISPYVHVDVNFDKAVLLLRDSSTGDVVRQIPTESQLEAYKRAQAAQTRAQSAAPKVETPSQSAEPAQAPVTAHIAPVQVAETPLPQITSSETSFAPQAGSVAYTPSTTTTTTVDTSA